MRFKMLVTSYLRWRSYRRTRGELAQLSDRELNDLGISRYDIAKVARDSAGL